MGNLAEGGEALCEIGDGIVGRSEGGNLDGAARAAIVHQHGGEVIGAALGQAGNGGGDLGVGVADLEVALLNGLGGVSSGGD